MSPATPPEARNPRKYWLPVMVLGFGLGSILLLLSNNWIQQRLIAPDIGLMRAVEEIQTQMAVTHLWIEEYVTGDDVDPDKFELGLARADALVTAIVAGNSSQRRTGSPAALEEQIRSLTARVAIDVGAFARLTRSRRAEYDGGFDVGIGSEVDIEYDRAFAELELDLEQLDRALILRLTTSERRARLLFRSLLIAWSLIIFLAAASLWIRERRQHQTEAALGDSQARLLQAQKMEAVGRLAGGLAHDINNYLAAIAAQCELVKMKAEPGDPTVNRMDAVLATTGRAGALIQRLLAFSRREPARPEPVDINQAIESLNAMLRQLLGEDIELETDLSPKLWPVKIDISQFEQIILNLAVNAREAMSTGGTLTIATRNVSGRQGKRRRGHDQPTDQVALSVADTGPGIPDSLQRKIFDPFFTTKEKSHSGLGLATVLGVVEQNDGRVRVDSTDDGARFEILLPRSSAQPSASSAQEPAVDLPTADSEKILLVEDNDELRRSTRDLLASWGYSVTAVAQGKEAISVFNREDGFDLLITDVVMPGLSGRQVAERLQALEPDLPVLYISGHTDDVVLRHGLEAGKVDLLEKPFSARQLAERTKGALTAASLELQPRVNTKRSLADRSLRKP